MIFDVAEGVAGAVDDRVRLAGNAEFQMVILRLNGDDRLLLLGRGRTGNGDNRLLGNRRSLRDGRLRLRFPRGILPGRSDLLHNDGDPLPRRGRVFPDAEAESKNEEQQEE